MEKGNRPELKELHCSDLAKEIDSFLGDGYRLDMIMPADDPREAIVSKVGESVRIVLSPGLSRQGPPEGGTQNWIAGRAGMEYRDLIPDRLDGRVIASHIRITEGGEVPDYVHYHKIWFQMIYCKSGSIRVVYEDQGPPFVLEAGDCVLQPSGIRHRVLESSVGAEVIEVSSPAEHETWVEHELKLPTSEVKSNRDFGGQKFVRHVGRHAQWKAAGSNCIVAETEIGNATKDMGRVRTMKIAGHGTALVESGDAFVFLYVISGAVLPPSKCPTLHADDHVVITDRSGVTLTALEDSEILEVRLREI
ncbi:MAG: cupin [Acidobacteria bacterium]|nr:MAG: cupin [Acidobacteriota bacterium]